MNAEKPTYNAHLHRIVSEKRRRHLRALDILAILVPQLFQLLSHLWRALPIVCQQR